MKMLAQVIRARVNKQQPFNQLLLLRHSQRQRVFLAVPWLPICLSQHCRACPELVWGV